MNSKTPRIALPVALIILAVIFGLLFFWRQEEKIEVQQEITPPFATPVVISEVKQATETSVPPSPSVTIENEVVVLPDVSRTPESVTSKSPVSTPMPILTTTTSVPSPTFTPEPLTNTPAFIVSSTPKQASETPVPGETKYSAEKINLEPVSLNVDLPGISVQDTETGVIFNSWSNSGQQFAFIASPQEFIDPAPPEGYSNSYNASELWIMSIDGNNLRKVADQGGSFVSWSPDDSQIAYFKQVGVFSRELWLANLKTNTLTKLDEPASLEINNTDFYGTHVDWWDEKHLLYTTYSLAGVYPTIRRHLWLHNIHTDQTTEIQVNIQGSNSWVNMWVAPDKTRVVISTDNDLWVGQLVEENEQFYVNYIKPLITEDSLSPHWSPNSTQVALQSYGQFGNLLRIITLNSSETIEIPFPHTIGSVQWSPDSQSLIISNFGAGTGLPNPVYAINSDGSNLRKLGEFFFGAIRWSPDGQYLSLLVPNDNSIVNNPFGIVKVDVSQ